MANISLSKETELNFKLNVEGAKEIPTVRFLMKFSEEYSVMISGTAANNIATVKIPKMPFLSEAKLESVPAKLEVIVDGQYFMPWADNLGIKKEVKVEAVTTTEEPLQEKADVSAALVTEQIISEEETPLEVQEEVTIQEEPDFTNDETFEEDFDEVIPIPVVREAKPKKHMKIDNISLEEFLNGTMTSDDLFG